MEENKPNHIVIFFVTLTIMPNLTSTNRIIQVPLTRHTPKRYDYINHKATSGALTCVRHQFHCEDFVILAIFFISVPQGLAVNFLMEKESNLTTHDGKIEYLF